MAEHDRLPLAPVLVEDLDAVLRGDLAHLMLSSHRGGRSCISERGDEIARCRPPRRQPGRRGARHRDPRVFNVRVPSARPYLVSRAPPKRSSRSTGTLRSVGMAQIAHPRLPHRLLHLVLPDVGAPATPRRTLPPFPTPTFPSGAIYEADKALVKK